jgi:hypothetical protein
VVESKIVSTCKNSNQSSKTSSTSYSSVFRKLAISVTDMGCVVWAKTPSLNQNLLDKFYT